jgi:hypothetical protein
MKKLVWIFGVLLALSFLVPNKLPDWVPSPKPTPVTPDKPTNTATNEKIVELLANASGEDRARIDGVYTAGAIILKRDASTKFLATTEQFSKWQERTLKMAIEEPGKYPGLDAAIEAVFATAVGTDDVVAVTDDMRAKLIAACETIANSAK